jgi:alpha-L-fucosidase
VYEVPVAAGRGFDVVLLQEDIRQGQRVEQFTLELCAGGDCREFARGTTIGYKRLLRFPEVQVGPVQRNARIRVTIGQTRAAPAVMAVAVYKMGAVEPQPAGAGALR